MYIQTLLNSLLELFLMVALGFFIKKINLVNDKTINELTNVLLSILLPFSIIASGNETCSREMISNIGLSFLIVSLYYIFAFLFSLFVFHFLAKDKKTKASSVNMCVFANTGFIGIPLSQILFGTDGVIYAVIYNLLYNVFLFTIGVSLFNGGKKKDFSIKEILLDPLSITSVIAICLFFSPVKLPSTIQSFLTSIGDMSGPVSMMIIGAWVVGMDFKKIIRRPISYAVCFIRLIALPLIIYFVLSLFDLNDTLRNSIILISALPIGSLNVIFAKKYNHDVSYVNETMMLSLCLSMITIPLIVMLF